MVALLKMPSGPARKPAASSLRIAGQDQSSMSLGGAERRMFPRKEVHTRVQGMRLDHTIEAHRAPHVSLALRDLSLGGLSAITQSPVGTGERVSVFFPPQGAQRGWDAYGRVLRCEPSGLGYRVAVEFDPLPAA